MRGKVMEEKIEVNIDKEQEKMLRAREAIQEYFKILSTKQEELIFDAIIKGG